MSAKLDSTSANSYSLHKQLGALLSKARRRMLLQMQLLWWPWLLLIVVLLLPLWPPFWVLLLVIALLVGMQLIGYRTTRYRALDLTSLLLHLNRQSPALEESAQLMLTEEAALSLLQRLQRRKVAVVLQDLLVGSWCKLLPAISYRPAIYHGLAASVLWGLIWLAPWKLVPGLPAPEPTVSTRAVGLTPPALGEHRVRVMPPAYTGQDARVAAALEFELLAGSSVVWALAIGDGRDDYSLYFDDGTVLSLRYQDGWYFSSEHIVRQGSIYSIGNDQIRLPGVYAITVTPDRSPSIEVLEPLQTITEFATNAMPQLRTVVDVRDDFGISEVSILASIAKGSGEAVKFRDQRFTFDRREVLADRTQYTWLWQLAALDMAPGDELYFTVHALDNRSPEPQLSRSQTRIVRWLEDAEEGMLSGGIVMDVMPAYFKSQRQIIIDTKQLVDDRPLLDANSFDRTAKELGQAQRDLKDKYGQYLGAEVEGGAGPPVIVLPSAALAVGDGHDAEHDADHDTGPKSQQAPEQGHEHGGGDAASGVQGSSVSGSEVRDRSGYNQLIAEFGHAHGDADIGIISQQNPKALMKRAIAEMWGAEVRLLLGEPELALPYENAALDFLNRAKQAERIYVKRLGFEPPPVTEKRRYQGELDDILTRQQRQEIGPGEAQLQRVSVQSLLALLTSAQTVNDFDVDQRQLLSDVKQKLVAQTVEQPTLIEALAILERLRLANSNRLVDCDGCVSRLTKALWQLLPVPVAVPVERQSPYSDQNPVVRDYSRFLERLPPDATP